MLPFRKVLDMCEDLVPDETILVWNVSLLGSLSMEIGLMVKMSA